MKGEGGEMPIACRLSDAELRERSATILSRFRSAVLATQEIDEGYAFHIPRDKLAIAADLIAAESECCRFLTFELIAPPNLGPVIFRVTGPSGTKEFLKTILAGE